MDRLWMTTGPVSLLVALVLQPVQAQPCLAQRKPWLVGLGAVLAALFLVFVFIMVYSIWCSKKEKEEGTVREEEKEAEGKGGLELEEKERPPHQERVESFSE